MNLCICKDPFILHKVYLSYHPQYPWTFPSLIIQSLPNCQWSMCIQSTVSPKYFFTLTVQCKITLVSLVLVLQFFWKTRDYLTGALSEVSCWSQWTVGCVCKITITFACPLLAAASCHDSMPVNMQACAVTESLTLRLYVLVTVWMNYKTRLPLLPPFSCLLLAFLILPSLSLPVCRNKLLEKSSLTQCSSGLIFFYLHSVYSSEVLHVWLKIINSPWAFSNC